MGGIVVLSISTIGLVLALILSTLVQLFAALVQLFADLVASTPPWLLAAARPPRVSGARP